MSIRPRRRSIARAIARAESRIKGKACNPNSKKFQKMELKLRRLRAIQNGAKPEEVSPVSRWTPACTHSAAT